MKSSQIQTNLAAFFVFLNQNTTEKKGIRMNTFEFNGGKVYQGISTQKDDRFGDIVFLGESGRGRRFERISLDKFRPAEVKEGRVHNASPKKVTLPPRYGRGPFAFFVLEKSNVLSKVLVRINTHGVYTRGSQGSWTVISGKPEKVTGGKGARGDAGRIGGWVDDLVVMQDGDVVKVKVEGGHKTDAYALWVADSQVQTLSWQDYENKIAAEKASSLIRSLENNLDEDNLLYNAMIAATWSRGSLSNGIKTIAGAACPVIRLGDDGRGRSYVDVPLIMAEEGIGTLDGGSVIEIDGENHGYAVVAGGFELESKAALVRVNTSWVYTRGSVGYVESWKGSPKILAKGNFAHGAAGRVGTSDDVLIVIHEGDVLYVHPDGGHKTDAYALYMKDGAVHTSEWRQWKIADAIVDPDFYVEKGTAPKGHAPESWIGSVVTAQRYVAAYHRNSAYLDDIATGELVSVNPPVLNLGWDGTDRRTVTISDYHWIRLETDKQVVQPDADMVQKRDELKEKAHELLEDVRTIPAEFLIDDRSLQYDVERYSEYTVDQVAAMPTDGYDSLSELVASLKHLLMRYNEVKTDIEDAVARQDSGEILVNFEARHRMGGMTGRGTGWVIGPDGSCRKHDEDSIPRHKHDGTLIWHEVKPHELALLWECSHMGDVLSNSQFEVIKVPVGGCTDEQLNEVAEIEVHTLGVPVGTFGLHTGIEEKKDRLVNEARDAMALLMRRVPDFSYNELISQNGVALSSENCLHNRSVVGISDLGADAREADRIDFVQLESGGHLEVITYYKYGSDNYAIRYRSKSNVTVE